ncbi:ABC transporter substrate-binding protein [Stackebrandtia nassauensis]|uniref:Extracellular solute-binding protein family 5 n=1 Tax=Stackebrandtia nassauensis (strain DSM 44728 / CIP 108903 / NRRL B-16338 / NBRC 102104 / LLR-40K-21) TaxID=446470 RepID=D3PVQ7_STANL|nr:ABC transporter substrate-binding protein [Stackebrandtia nassauensis]ADD43171.1 extracellular solute-binding protein family 5 [Stackebrandtia nassauensis DSM 44728]
MSPASRFGRRLTAVIGALATLSLLLAGCSGSQAEPGKLVIGVTTDANALFPWKATQFQSIAVLQNLYGTLTEFDKDLKVVPGLAESWDTSKDGRTLTFHLRSGVTFADGSAFDSADVKDSLDKIRDPKTAAVAASTLASVKKVTAPDADTVTLKLSGPDAALPSNLASVNTAMLSSDDTEKQLAAKPNGTGPFAFDSRKPSQTLKLKKNDAYWGEAPKLDSVEFRVIPDDDSILAAMQAGNVQFAVFDNPVVGQTAEDLGLNVAKTSQLSYHALQLNAKRDVLSDVNTRLAVQCAIDRSAVLDTAGFGEGKVTGPITSPDYLSDPDDRPCPTRDLDKSAEYLRKAGKDSLTLKTIVSQGEYATSVDEAQNLKSQLADANIELDLEVLESGAFVDAWVGADFDAAVALNGGREDPDGMYGRYFTSTGNLNKVAGYSSPTLDKLFAEGRSTSDLAKREEIYTKVGRELEDNAAWIWLFSGFTYTATTANVHGFTPLESGSLQYLRTTSVD